MTPYALKLKDVKIGVIFSGEMARDIQKVAEVHDVSYSEAIRLLCRSALAMRKSPSAHEVVSGTDDALEAGK
jgi:hypothetical protein